MREELPPFNFCLSFPIKKDLNFVFLFGTQITTHGMYYFYKDNSQESGGRRIQRPRRALLKPVSSQSMMIRDKVHLMEALASL